MADGPQPSVPRSFDQASASEQPLRSVDREAADLRPELVVGFVGPIGSDLGGLIEATAKCLKDIGYVSTPVAKATEEFSWAMPHAQLPTRRVSIKERYDAYMQAGDDFRQALRHNAAAVLPMLRAIAKHRVAVTGDPTGTKPAVNTAFLVDSLKTPEEAELLRAIYGPRFVLIAAYCPRKARVSNLASKVNRRNPERGRGDATLIIDRDEEGQDDNSFGQNVRGAFPLADLIVLADGSNVTMTADLTRFFDMLFDRDAVHTPTIAEQSMFLAFAASLRSSSLNRQVGAALVSEDGQVIAIGTNETPKAFGGAYWPNQAWDKRTFRLSSDPSRDLRKDLLTDMLDRLARAGWNPPPELLDADMDTLAEHFQTWQEQEALAGRRSDTLLDDTIEFYREVHAEMAAITDAARRGVGVDQHTLYTTTFPCHDCAKHALASGIKTVVFLEPYPKSLVRQLHDDAVYVQGDIVADDGNERVAFNTFVGVAPRCYTTLFKFRREGEKRPGQLRTADFYALSGGPTSADSVAALLAIRSEIVAYQELRALAEQNLGVPLERVLLLRHDGDPISRPTIAEVLQQTSDRLAVHMLGSSRIPLLRGILEASLGGDARGVDRLVSEYIAVELTKPASAEATSQVDDSRRDKVNPPTPPSQSPASPAIRILSEPSSPDEHQDRGESGRIAYLRSICRAMQQNPEIGKLSMDEYLVMHDHFVPTAAAARDGLNPKSARDFLLAYRRHRGIP